MDVVCVSSIGAYAAQRSLARALTGSSDATLASQMGYLTRPQRTCWVSADTHVIVAFMSGSFAHALAVAAGQLGHCETFSSLYRPRSAPLLSASSLASAWRLFAASFHGVVFTPSVDGCSVISFRVVGHGVQPDPRGLCFGTDNSVGDGGHLARGFYGSRWLAWYVVTALPVAWAIPGPDPARARLLPGFLFDHVCLVAWAYMAPTEYVAY